jgi:hypothetical protein
MKRIAIALAAITLAGTTLAVTAPAQARDTTWGCPGCIATHR